MNSLPGRFLTLAFLILATTSAAQAQLLGFENLSTPPAIDSNTDFASANGSLVYGGVAWDSRLRVVGINYEVNTGAPPSETFPDGLPSGPFFSGGAPRGGDYYITNQGDVDGITLDTTKILTSLYLGSTELYGYYPGEGASAVTIIAMNGSTQLDSLTFTLTPNTQTGGPNNTAVGMDLFDTSAFLSLTGITGYVINRTPNSDPDSDNGNASWVADNFTFIDPLAVPEPSSGKLALLVSLVLIGSLGWNRLRLNS